jgi:hypothetical protein
MGKGGAGKLIPIAYVQYQLFLCLYEYSQVILRKSLYIKGSKLF